MNTLAAAVLLHLAGKPVDEAGIKKVVEASGKKADDAAVKKIVESLKGKDVLKFAKDSLANAAPKAAPAKPAEEKKDDKKKDDKKKEEKKKAPEPDDDDDDLGGLF